MALNAYLTLKGQKSGQIKGSVTQKGHEDSIMVIDMDRNACGTAYAQTNCVYQGAGQIDPGIV